MNKRNLEEYLGRKIMVQLFDNEVITGYLRKTGDEAFKNNPNLYIPKNYYFLTKTKESTVSETCLFRVSHIKGFKVIFD